MIIASIDLQEGKAVQLRRGLDKVLERDDPAALAVEFGRLAEVAVIDLDAAMGRGDNRELVERLLPLARCRVGGGIRSAAAARRWLQLGASKVIVGSAAFRDGGVNRPLLEELAAAVGRQRLVLAVDAAGGRVVVDGWRREAGLDALAALQELEPYCGEFLCTCVEGEGCLRGIDLEQVRRLRRATARRLTVAGGVSTLRELLELTALGVDVQLGMALYTGRLQLEAAFAAALDWGKGLLPTVVQDEAGRVLMLAYSSRESLRRTLAEGRMTYHSRSRGGLWRKGDTSGHFQDLLRLRADCDADALLATVRQQGSACHEGGYSCFGDERFAWEDLFAVVGERLRRGGRRSYTRSLGAARVRQKLIEEAGELALARGRDQLVWEAADLLYFATVLLARRGIGPEAVLGELRRRRRA
jgi:phosphoribosyl-ATP pyrophosphohydrolase/phosphoribosyl-AMP cyclohydrolase